MNKIGIIPVGGLATRFGGALKELLPVVRTSLIIDYSVTAMLLAKVDYIYFILSPKRWEIIPQIMKEHYPDHSRYFMYIPQPEPDGLWDAISRTPYSDNTQYLFAMPDTVISHHSFAHFREEIYPLDFGMGLFETSKPENFGAVIKNRIYDKDDTLVGTTQTAWGCVAFSSKLYSIILKEFSPKTDYNVVFNCGIDMFGAENWQLPYYYDIASLEAYKDFLKEWKA